MEKSHAADRASVPPTPAQLKELFAQIEAGKMTKSRMQAMLRDETTTFVESTPKILPIHFWMLEKGFLPADWQGSQMKISSDYTLEPSFSLGFLKNETDQRSLPLGRFRPPLVAVLTSFADKFDPIHLWVMQVLGSTQDMEEFQKLAFELRKMYGVKVGVRLKRYYSREYYW